MDIALLDGNMYLTTQTMDRSWAKVIILSIDGSITSVGQDLNGHIASGSGQLHFVSSGQFIETKEYLSFESGRNYMVNIQENVISKITELPYSYTPGDIHNTDNGFLMLSRTHGTIDRFDLNGQYVSTSYQFKGDVNERRGLTAFTIVDRDLYVVNKNTNRIVHLQYQGD